MILLLYSRINILYYKFLCYKYIIISNYITFLTSFIYVVCINLYNIYIFNIYINIYLTILFFSIFFT